MDIKTSLKLSRICAILLTLCMVCTGCQELNSLRLRMNEDEMYAAAVNAFLNALDAGDTEAIYAMFSPAVQAADTDLREQITYLTEIYPGPTDACGNDGLLMGEYSYDSGQCISSVSNHFPVLSNGEYFWCHLTLMYENETDKSQIGITQILFLTGDEESIFRYDDAKKYTDDVGLTVYAESTLEREIRAINGSAYQYTPTDTLLNLSDVKAFFARSNRYTEFVKQFGEPNAVWIYYCYELPAENGKPRYLQLGVTEESDSIYSANIVDDFGYMETVRTSEE